MFPVEYRDVKGVAVEIMTCPPCRAARNKAAKSPAGVARRKRNKATEKGRQSAQNYAHSTKRQSVLKKYNDSDKRRENSARWNATAGAAACRKRAFAKWYSKMALQPDWRAMSNMRKRMSKHVKGTRPSETLSALVGDVAAFRAHLEELFDCRMSWTNYTVEWEIGHGIPFAAYNHSLKSDVDKCWSLENLFPQMKKENRHLGSRIHDAYATKVHLFPSHWKGSIPESGKTSFSQHATDVELSDQVSESEYSDEE